MRMRKKKNLLPRMERCTACRVQDGFALKGRWRESLMPAAAELRLEIRAAEQAIREEYLDREYPRGGKNYPFEGLSQPEEGSGYSK